MRYGKAIIISAVMLATIAAVRLIQPAKSPMRGSDQGAASIQSQTNIESPEPSPSINFSGLNPVFKFSGDIPSSWRVEYLPGADSINIYDAAADGAGNLAKSAIFIRHFRASSFLTLNSVDILSRTDAQVNGHAAVRYEIRKKAGVPDFPGQPSWRSGRHKLIDIRHSAGNPSEFYVIAQNPTLPDGEFEAFISSLEFDND